MSQDACRLLADWVDALPNGFPPTPDGAELRLIFLIRQRLLAAGVTMQAC